MAVPKKKTTPSKRGMRNSHTRLILPIISECSSCGASKLSHHICSACGTYKNKKVMITKQDKESIRAEQSDKA